jgi:hypothetical protein
MHYYVRVDDLEGNIKFYFRFEDQTRALAFYKITCTQHNGKPGIIKLMDKEYTVLATTVCGSNFGSNN